MKSHVELGNKRGHPVNPAWAGALAYAKSIPPRCGATWPDAQTRTVAEQQGPKPVAAPSKYDVPDRMTYLIEGLVRPKQRPRPGKRGQFYTPAETRDSENHIRLAVLQILGQRRPRTDGRYAVTLEFVGQNGDLDNLAKTVLDACNRLLWNDDRQVDSLVVSKAMGPSSFVCMTVVRKQP